MIRRLSAACLLSAAACLAQQYTISTVAGGSPPTTPGLATSASIGAPQYLAVDSANAVYFTSSHCVYKLTTNGLLSRVAGNSRPGYAGDGSSALSAQLSSPAGLTVDASGNVFVADVGNNRIREIAANGTITTVAGNGIAGFTGDSGAAVTAQLSAPAGVAVDAQGNILIADTGNNRIRKVTPAGIISTLVQSPVTSIALDAAGNIYIGDSASFQIRKRTADGNISIVAGNGSQGYSGDGGSALAAQLSAFHQISVDSLGNVYVADAGNSVVRKIFSDLISTITTLAGNGTSGFSGDGASATLAALSHPWGVAVNSRREAVIADSSNFRLRVVDTDGKITSVAGTGYLSYGGDGRVPLNAQFLSPQGLALDSAGNLLVADSGNNRVRRIPVTGTVSTIAGNGEAGTSGDDGLATNARLSNPRGVAVIPSSGQIFIADTGNSRVRLLFPGGGITAFAGTENSGASGVTADSTAVVYFGDSVNHRVRAVASDGTITTIAGNGQSGFSGDDGPAVDAKLSTIPSLAVDADGVVYFVDGQRVRKVTKNGIITTVVGTDAQLKDPGAIAVDTSGNLYIADTGNHRIRKVTSTGTITTIAGNGLAGYMGDGGVATSASLWSPAGLVVSKSGTIYVSDTGNNAIRLLTPGANPVIISSVLDAGAETPTALSPGKIIVIYGSGLGPDQLVVNQPLGNSFSQQLAGTTVSVRGLTAPIYYTSSTQVAAIVPYEITGSTSVPVLVAYQPTGLSAPFNMPFAATSPGFFTANASGAGQLAAINSDGTLNSATNPIKAGSYISLYVTGEGALTPAGRDGQLAPLQLPIPAPVAKVTATIGGKDAKILYAGSTPGTVYGLMQLTVEIPADVTPGGYVPVVVTVGGTSTVNGAVTIAVKN